MKGILSISHRGLIKFRDSYLRRVGYPRIVSFCYDRDADTMTIFPFKVIPSEYMSAYDCIPMYVSPNKLMYPIPPACRFPLGHRYSAKFDDFIDGIAVLSREV